MVVVEWTGQGETQMDSDRGSQQISLLASLTSHFQLQGALKHDSDKLENNIVPFSGKLTRSLRDNTPQDRLLGVKAASFPLASCSQ